MQGILILFQIQLIGMRFHGLAGRVEMSEGSDAQNPIPPAARTKPLKLLEAELHNLHEVRGQILRRNHQRKGPRRRMVPANLQDKKTTQIQRTQRKLASLHRKMNPLQPKQPLAGHLTQAKSKAKRCAMTMGSLLVG